MASFHSVCGEQAFVLSLTHSNRPKPVARLPAAVHLQPWGSTALDLEFLPIKLGDKDSSLLRSSLSYMNSTNGII